MKQFSLNKQSIFKKTVLVIFVATCISHALLSFTIKKITEDVWGQLGITSQQGTESIRESFLGNYLQYYKARNAKNIATGNRAAVAKDLLDYTKKYISSNTFKMEYEKLRLNAKPAEPEQKIPRTKEDIRKEKIAEAEQTLKKMEASMKDLAPDMQKIVRSSMEIYDQQIKDYKDPNNQLMEMFAEGEKMNIEQEQRQYDERYKKWQADFPASVNEIIKKRLRYYVDLSATVDFGAALTEKNRKMVFVKQAYESKPNDWKMIYRAGKEINEVSRPFVLQWISELK